MTPKEIAETMIAATSLTEETGLAELYAYRRAKRATGAPADLESAVLHAGRECQDAADALAKYLKRAAEEAAKNAAYIAEHGVRFWEQTWFVLDGRTSAESLGRVLRAKREHFQALIAAWAAVADRIVATDEDRARAAEEKARWREAQIAAWCKKPKAVLAERAAGRCLPDTGTREEIAARLVDAGAMP